MYVCMYAHIYLCTLCVCMCTVCVYIYFYIYYIYIYAMGEQMADGLGPKDYGKWCYIWLVPGH